MTILGEKAIVQCDGCEVIVDMPIGNAEWVVLVNVHVKGTELRAPMDFCSELCLERYLTTNRGVFNEHNGE